jgi:hypothetical protein
MNTITIGRTTYKLRDTSTIFADHAKCTGKHKIVKSKGNEKRVFPTNGARMSTADYVFTYFRLNPHAYTGANKDGFYEEIAAFFQPLAAHISQPQGEDTFEVIE